MILSAPIYVLKRRAKAMARAEAMPLAQALDIIAKAEGYQSWSHLSAADAALGRPAKLLARLTDASLTVLAARPAQGKTLLGLELLIEALQQRRPAHFFTLEYTQTQVRDHLRALAPETNTDALQIDTSDHLNAAHITAQLGDAAPRGLVVIDYLQLLDQRRDTAPLAAQLQVLKAFAQVRQLTLICLSQIDRSYDPKVKSLPDINDLRLPNPVDLAVFDQMIFLGEGGLRLRTAA